MGKLFWKFFAFLWLAQLLTTFGVGIAIWSHRTDHRPPPPPAFAHERGAPPMPPRERAFPFLPPPEPLVGGMLASLVSAALLAWYFSRPIRNLRRAFDAAAQGDLAVRIGTAMGKRKDELADLGGDFDRMAARLQGLIAAQRRLSHDVSHELRSPLARLQAAVGLLRQQPERAAEMIERIERDTARMDRLVGELLTLARLEAGTTARADETVDLVELIEAVAADARFEAEAAGCTVKLALPPACTVAGDGELLQRALENVVRNALRHSPPARCINIELDTDGGEICLRVADRGPGVAAEALERIFSAFVREGNGKDGGYGLGLAITRAVLELHGGRVTAANREGGGLLVTLVLPKASGNARSPTAP